MWRKSKTKDHSELMEQYQQIREIAQQLYNEVLPQYLPKEAFQTCGKKLGIMHKSTLVFSDMDCMAVLMDYCLYEYRVKGKNAIARYLAEAQLDPNSLEGMVTQAMSDSFYALLQVEEALRGIGIKVHDFVRDRRFLLVDINLGRTAVPGVVIATRVLPHEDFATTSGAPLSVNAEVLSQLRSLLTQRRVDEEEGKNDEQAWADLATSVIRTCLAGHADSKMEHRETNIESISAPLRKDARVGRNDPCPCGSGRKHKRCCGALASL